MGETPDVHDLRGHQRYTVNPPVTATYGSVSVAVLNMSPTGLLLEHPDPLKLRATSRISIPFPGVGQQVAELRGEIQWSRLSKKPNSAGKYLYRSGVKLLQSEENISVIARLLHAYGARPDSQSLERKRELLKQKQEASAGSPHVRMLKMHGKQVDPDRVLLIRQVAARLKENPAEMNTLASRARSALSIRIDSVVNTDEILAVWEYLQRLVTLDDIRDVLGIPTE